jgi:hypothetical protein
MTSKEVRSMPDLDENTPRDLGGAILEYLGGALCTRVENTPEFMSLAASTNLLLDRIGETDRVSFNGDGFTILRSEGGRP